MHSAIDTDNDDCTANDFVGYNEWAQQELDVKIATDFVYEVEGDERGVFIAEDIGPHTEVFSIPLASLLTVDAACRDPVLGELAFFQQSCADTEDDQLAVALLYEKWVRRDDSRWRNHITLLPKAYHNVLYFPEDALTHLHGSNLYLIAKQMTEKVASDYARLQDDVLAPLFDAVADRASAEELQEWFSLSKYKWALSTIWSRFVSLRVTPPNGSQSGNESEDDEERGGPFFGMQRVKAMIPVFDMLNHDPEAEMSHYLDVATQKFKLVSHQHWSAGAQMYINYGALSNHKLLALYGFVIPNNPYDALDLWVSMDEASCSYYHEKTALLSANGLDHATTPFELTADELNELLLITVRIEEIECDSVEQLEVLAAKALDGEVLSFDNEHMTLTRLIYTLQKMLDEFDGTLEDDDAKLREWAAQEGELSDETGDDGEDNNKKQSDVYERMAVIVRRSDKLILKETIDMLKWKLLEILPTS
uniref:Rubisco LSMT substrate-binding domain-containing protein n=1 Tax=Globisporangium ultimum (strain ATCC 200006 / CBS 805.95 / DAOM BR144) TaxID=431595 RepID=K3WI22_GLOUD